MVMGPGCLQCVLLLYLWHLLNLMDLFLQRLACLSSQEGLIFFFVEIGNPAFQGYPCVNYISVMSALQRKVRVVSVIPSNFGF